MKRCLVSFAVSGLLVLASAASASAFTVTTTSDATSGACSLRVALAEVAANTTAGNCTRASGDNTITLPAGTYTLSSGTELHVLSPSPAVTIVGADPTDPTQTVIDAVGTPAIPRRVLEVDSGRSVTLQNLEVKGGQTADGANGVSAGSSGSPGADGSGILNMGSLTLDHVLVTDNFTGSGGSGQNSSGDGHNSGSGNTGGSGGGIYSTGALSSPRRRSPATARAEAATAATEARAPRGSVTSLTGMTEATAATAAAAAGSTTSAAPRSPHRRSAATSRAPVEPAAAADTARAQLVGSPPNVSGAGDGGEGGLGGNGSWGPGNACIGCPFAYQVLAGGGGIASLGPLTMTASTISGNNTGAGGMGGAAGLPGQNANNTFQDAGHGGDGGSAGIGGGLLFTGSTATATLTNVTIAGNFTGDGGTGGGGYSGATGLGGGRGGYGGFGGGIWSIGANNPGNAVVLKQVTIAQNGLGAAGLAGAFSPDPDPGSPRPGSTPSSSRGATTPEPCSASGSWGTDRRRSVSRRRPLRQLECVGPWGPPDTRDDAVFTTSVGGPPAPAASSTGERAAALKKCKKKDKRQSAGASCIKKAKKLPV